MRLLFLLAVTFGSIVCSAFGQSPESSPAPSPAAAQKLHVVTRDLEPFSFERNARRVGFAMELWDNVAREAKFEYDVSVASTAKEMIAEVQAKKADVGVGALSITAEREKVIDFSQPFYESGLDILTVGGSGGITGTLWMILGNLLNWQLLGGLAAFILAMLVVSHLVWMYEHKVNSDMWPENYRQGMWESFWWSISIFLVGGADNKGPVGLGGRLVAIVWMLMSIVAISLFTASLTTALTVNSLKPAISSYRDLPGVKVATIGGSSAESWLQKNDCVVSTFSKIDECIDALKSGKVKAVVYDAPILQYATSKMNDDELLLVDNLFDRNNYGFALQQDSPIRETVNQALLSLSEQGVIDSLKQKWFKSGE